MKRPQKSKDSVNAHKLARRAAAIAFDKKATDICILDMRKLTSIVDYFIICTGNVDIHVKAIVDDIDQKLRPEAKPWHIEGYDNLRWVLLDYVDFVVHVFQPEQRAYYNLEKLWADAPLEHIGTENPQ
jgi:ribosome-associated protein